MRFEDAGHETAGNTATSNGSRLNYAEVAEIKPGKKTNGQRPNSSTDSPADNLAIPPSDQAADKNDSQRLGYEIFGCPSYTVRPKDTLDSIAKGVMGPNASKESIKECAEIIRSMNQMQSDRPQEQKTLAIPVRNSDGSISYSPKRDCAEQYTRWPDGTLLMEDKSTGKGFSQQRKFDGNTELKEWGPQASDNKLTTYYLDNSVKMECSDGTGYVRSADGRETHWGPKTKDNYTTAYDFKTDGQQGKSEELAQDGTRKTTWPDGTERVQRPDGSGYVSRQDGSLESWGAKASDNYKERFTASGEKEVTYLDGLKYVQSANGTCTELKPDGTRAQWKANQDGTSTVVEIDKHGEASSMYISMDRPPNKRH